MFLSQAGTRHLIQLKTCWGLSFTVGSSIWFCFQTSQEIIPLLRNHFCRWWAAEKLEQTVRPSSRVPKFCRASPTFSKSDPEGFSLGIELKGSAHPQPLAWLNVTISVHFCHFCNSFQPVEHFQERTARKPKTPEAQFCPQPSPAGQGLSLKLLF